MPCIVKSPPCCPCSGLHLQGCLGLAATSRQPPHCDRNSMAAGAAPALCMAWPLCSVAQHPLCMAAPAQGLRTVLCRKDFPHMAGRAGPRASPW